jgi:hypothetical protein
MGFLLWLTNYNSGVNEITIRRLLTDLSDRQKQHHEMLKHLVEASLYLDISSH